jgi:hypothetical protein
MGYESFMTKAGRLGNKAADVAVNGLKWGQKAAGQVVKYGQKGLDIAKHATSAIERTPFVGMAAAPVTGALRSAIGVGENIVSGAEVAGSAMGRAATGIRASQSALQTGDVNQAMNVMRDTATDTFAAGRALKSTAKSALEKRGKP